MCPTMLMAATLPEYLQMTEEKEENGHHQTDANFQFCWYVTTIMQFSQKMHDNLIFLYKYSENIVSELVVLDFSNTTF